MAGFGPWTAGLSDAERIARCRALRALAVVLTGRRGDQLVAALRTAEADPARLPGALAALESLSALDRRRLLSAYAVVDRPSVVA
jgi:hypothetical protein